MVLPASKRLLGALATLLVLVVVAPEAGASVVLSRELQTQEEGILQSLDFLRTSNLTTSVTRSGLLDKVVYNGQELGICHLAVFLPYSLLTLNGRIPFSADTISSAAMLMAMNMLNNGDGSVIKEVEGLNERCPIRFTQEFFDSALSSKAAVTQAVDVVGRTTPGDQEVCAFFGPASTTAAIAMTTLTGVFGRPQLVGTGGSNQLDDKTQFPLVSTAFTPITGSIDSLLIYLKNRNIKRFGLVTWNTDNGVGYARSFLEKATLIHPELVVISTSIPPEASAQDFEEAVAVLRKAQVRWSFGWIRQSGFETFVEECVRQGMAGTGEHVWFFVGALLDPASLSDLAVEKGSPMALGLRGVGLFFSQGGRKGLKVYDDFVARLQELNNSKDIVFVDSKLPSYPDEPMFPRLGFQPEAFSADPSVFAASEFDSVILAGLAACQASSISEDPFLFNGTTMVNAMRSISFEGASGNVTLDPITGTRRPESGIFYISNSILTELNQTHVKFNFQESSVFLDGRWVVLEPFVYNDGTTNEPGDLPPFSTDQNYIGTELRGAGLAMSGAILACSLGFAMWTVMNRSVMVVRASQPIFLLILCSGTFVMGASIIALSIDDEIASVNGCSVACMAAPWLMSLGFATIFAALFSKTWRVNRLFTQGQAMRRVKVTAFDVMLPLICLLLLNVIVLTVWTIVSPLEWAREVTAEDVFFRPISSRGFCTSDDTLPFAIVLLVADLGSLLFASYQSYLARGISTEFAESEYIGKAIACMLLVSFVGVPTMIIVNDEPKAQFFVLTSIIFVLCTAVLCFIFVPKILYARRNKGISQIKTSIQKSSNHKSNRSLTVHNNPASVPLSHKISSQEPIVSENSASAVEHRTPSHLSEQDATTEDASMYQARIAALETEVAELQILLSDKEGPSFEGEATPDTASS